MKNTKKKNVAAAKGKGRATLSAQQTIPYLSMHPDGVCKLPGGLYTKTVEYEDINYSVASTEDQTAIFSGWSSFLNYFDSSLPFQLSFINRRSHSRSRYQVNIPKADDNYNSVRDEFTGMLKNQIAKSNNGIERSKYITFGIPAEGIAEARPRLERVEADVMGNFKRLGVPSEPMDGRARLALLHSQMHPGSREARKPIKPMVSPALIRIRPSTPTTMTAPARPASAPANKNTQVCIFLTCMPA